MLKKEHKLRIIKHKEWFTEYRLLAHTFRMCVQLFIGNPTDKVFNSFWRKYWIDYLDWRNKNKWFYIKETKSNIIWIKDYHLCTLVHELTHLIDKETEDRWLETEARAYIIESLLAQAQYLSENKFKIEKWFDLFI
jgi:hypothetical protein